MTNNTSSEDLREELFYKYSSGYADSSGESHCAVEKDNAKLMLDEYAAHEVKSNSQGLINFILEVCDTKELIGQTITLEELKSVIQIAKDNWFTIRAKELLSWMAKHDVDCKVITGEGDMFYYKGELITADQLFENFL